ncbi:peroxisomal biogenesis factor 11 [Ascobolus immersus RN42]|uniref:Peroxisomal biogenesis factor 11 n=1 Tax=Ascobolus immersus RN42 TaxID=1160509 RepID=A0A3N4IF55_ASCIM|nr:peroxisomal biogenesis factor 11 [Ascobolus immersus RN42]
MAVDAFTYHPTVAHYLRFVATTIGRDKCLRLIQYFARFLSFYLYRKGHTSETVRIFNTIKAQLGLTRKIMRVGKNVEHFKAAGEAVDKRGVDPITRYLSVGRQLGYGGYLTFDALTVLDAAGIYKYAAAKKFQRWAYKFWLAGIVFSIVSGIYSLNKMKEKTRRAEKAVVPSGTEVMKLEKEKKVLNLQLLSDIADFCIPSSALGYLNLDDGFVGLAGMVSSYIGLQGAWNKTA